MKPSAFSRLLVCGFAALLLLTPLTAARAGGGERHAPAVQQELAALDLEQIYRLALAGDGPKPVYRNLGGGLHSLTVPLPPELRDRLLQSADPDVGERAISTFILLATGWQLTNPFSASTLIHAALFDVDFAYNHWWAVVNLGSKLTKSTTLKQVRGATTRFNKTFNVIYNGGSIIVSWYNPGTSAKTVGVYELTTTVKDATRSPVKVAGYGQ